MMRGLEAILRKPRTVLTMMVVMVMAGVWSYITIPKEADPDIQVPVLYISIPLDGISPEDAVRLLARPMEEELRGVEGVKELTSISSQGHAAILVEFEAEIDAEVASRRVREKVDIAKAELPSDAEEPTIDEINLSLFPTIIVALSGHVPERTLYRHARTLQDEIEAIPSVLEARLSGHREELLEVIIDDVRLESYNISQAELITAVTQNNRLVAAGALDTGSGRFNVKVPGLFETAQDVFSLPVKASGDRVVTLADVADVRRTFVDPTRYARFNGRPAIAIEVVKRIGTNIVENNQQVRDVVARVSRDWPDSVHINFAIDQSTTIFEVLGSLQSGIMTAIALVMIVVVAALGTRSALFVGIAIPTSFMIGFLLMEVLGMTINMMLMFGLVLTVGMLVDGAIVVIEYADRRMGEGASRRAAYLEASKRMFWPVITSTATTLVAFVPFLFWKDIAGEFMKYLPLTLIFVLTSSLVAALIFLPVLGALLALPEWFKKRFGVKGKTDAPPAYEIDEIDPTSLHGAIGAYARFLAGLVQRPLLALAGALGLIAVCYGAFAVASPDVEYFIRNDTEEINILVQARGNLSERQKIDITEEVAGRIKGHPAIEFMYIQTGPQLARNSKLPPDTIGQIGVNLIYYSERDHSRLVQEEFRNLVDGVPGVKVEVRQREGGPPIGKDVQVELNSPSFAAMALGAKKLRDFVDTTMIEANGRDTPVYMDQEDTLPLPGIEWSMDVDRALAGRYGLSVQQAGAVLQFVTDGLLIDTYRPDDSEDEVDIRVRYPEADRTILALDRVRVQTPRGSVPLSNFVARQAKPQVDRIVRRGGERIIEVKANGNTRIPGHEISQDQAIAHMKAWLESGGLGEAVAWKMRGADEDTAEAANFFGGAMAAAMFMIALILLLEFNSFYHAALTLSAVVLSVFGVLLGIALSGQYISVIMTGTGVVALAGIVVNNNIVLIDTYQYLRRKGLAVEAAVVRTAAQRIRPVLLTTVTTILGLLPMVFEINVNFAAGTVTRGSTTSDWWVLLASAIVYGLAFSTVLTLILTPVMLAAPAVLRRRLWGRKAGVEGAPLPKPTLVETDRPQAAE